MRNFPALTAQEQQTLAKKHVLVLGCGGLGGFICEYLVRLGVGEITAADPDCFEASNLNRQLLCSGQTLEQSKAETACARAAAINPEVRFHAFRKAFRGENAAELLAGKDLVIDALDNADDRLTLEDACAEVGVTLVHGAVHGWTAQIAAVTPGSGVLRRLYQPGAADGDKSCLVFAPALCAAVQTAEAVKLLTGRPSSLAGKLMLVDLQTMDTEIIAL